MLDQASAQLQAIGDVIRFAVAPVFLLSGVGIMLTAMTNRLARVVDRARALEQRAGAVPLERHEAEVHEPLAALARRARLLGIAITLLTICALLVSMVVILLFLAAFFDVAPARTIAALFIVAMCAFVAALTFFLREILLGIASLRIGLRR